MPAVKKKLAHPVVLRSRSQGDAPCSTIKGARIELPRAKECLVGPG